MGYLAQDHVEKRLGGVRTTAALGAVAGVALVLADRQPVDRRVGPAEAAVAGLAQVAALAPGVSRQGAALTALRAMRVDRREAARFATLMSLPVTLGGALLTAWRAGAAPPVVPVVVSAVTAAGAARRVRSGSRAVVRGSALYRLGVAAAVAARVQSQGRERG